MEEQGDLRSGEDGTEGSAGFPQLRPLTHTPAPQVLAPRRKRAAYCGMQVSCGVKGRRRHSPGEKGHLGPKRAPGKARGLATGAPIASPGSCHGAWSCSPGPGFATGECLWRTPGKGGRLCLHGEGGWSSGGLRSQRSQSLLA